MRCLLPGGHFHFQHVRIVPVPGVGVSTQTILIGAAKMKLPASGNIGDLWLKQDVTGTKLTVPSNGVVLLKVR